MSIQEELPDVREMAIVFGGNVKLEDIVGRDKLVERIISTLLHTSVIINEIRRFGKTTFLRLLETKVPEDWICVRATVQDARTTTELIELTLQSILNHAHIKDRNRIGKIILEAGHAAKNAKVSFNGLEFSLNSEHKTNAFSTFRSILNGIGKQLIKEGTFMVIMWDEFPDAIRTIAEKEGKPAAEDIMKFFRARRENREMQNIRWVLTGSIGIHHVLRSLSGSDSINDVVTFSLDPLDSIYIRWMSKCLLLGINKDLNGSDRLADISGGIPFVLEMMIKYIRDFDVEAPQSAKEAERLLVDSASDVNLGRNWAPLLERVDFYYGRHAKLAESVLDMIAAAPMEQAMILELAKNRFSKPVNENTLDTVLGLLFEDHYLKYDILSQLYSWKYEPLRIIWRARRRKGI